MKRYIIKIDEFEGIEIRRFDGFFKDPFTVRETYTEDDEGWCWSSRTSTHMKLLLHRMEQMGKADRVDNGDRLHNVWVVDVIDGLAVGQYLPYGDRPHAVLLPTMNMIRALDLGPGPEEL